MKSTVKKTLFAQQWQLLLLGLTAWIILPSCNLRDSNEVSPPGIPPMVPQPLPKISHPYQALGIGGGGAMSSFSTSPANQNLWFVATDMGTLFRSPDQGATWEVVDHKYVTYSANLELSAPLGFSSDGQTVYFVNAGTEVKRSRDTGITFESIRVPLNEGERISYWINPFTSPNIVFAATNQGLLKSTNGGDSWNRISTVSGSAKGSMVDGQTGQIFHAVSNRIYRSTNEGESFEIFFQPSGNTIRSFAGGRDANGLTLAYLDNDGSSACSWASETKTKEKCGYVWISTNQGPFLRTGQYGGEHLGMAENDSQTIYVTGARGWERAYGTKIWISTNAGRTFDLVLHQLNWDKNPYEIWPKLELSAVGLDRGYWDDGCHSFWVNPRNSAMAGCTGNFFLHVTGDRGQTWKAPFTQYADIGPREPKKKWRSIGLEMTSIFRAKFHPDNPLLMYLSAADVSGLVSEDGGKTFRITSTGYNTTYDYAFEPGLMDVVYAAAGATHDFPYNWHGNYMKSEGGVFKSNDKGHTWIRLTPNNETFNRQFLSIAYDHHRKVLYAGSQGDGIVRSTDGGKSWHFFNAGLPTSPKIIPQIEVDPATGNAYALLTGDAPDYTNGDYTGIYKLNWGSTNWTLLRGSLERPPGVNPSSKLWNYPTAFEIDLRPSGNRRVIWLTDQERAGAWMATGVWKSEDEGSTWSRLHQFTHPQHVEIDPSDPERVYLSGPFTIDGSWGNGGALYTTDGGRTWRKNDLLPLRTNLHAARIDPNNPDKIFYLFFGGGILYGPKPN